MSYYDKGGGMDRENARIRANNQFNRQMALTRAAAPSRAAPAAPAGGGGLTGAAKAAYEKAIAQYQPGGGFMKGVEAGLGRSRTKSMASGMQSLVSSGLSGSTMAAGLGKKWDEEVGAPTRAGAESQRVQGLASLYASLGGAEQGAFEGSANRSQQLGLATMNMQPPMMISGGGGGSSARTPNPYMRSLLGGGGGGGGGGASPPKTGGYGALLDKPSFFS